jgi:undecaprenyl-diphosphatase
MWLFQQFGNLVVALVVVVVIALVMRRTKLLAAAVGAVGLKLVLERLVKQIVERERPGTTIVDVIMRGNVPAHGLSFVSGHAVITAAMATILMPLLPRRWVLVAWAFVVLNGIARVYVGAHNPLDVVGGIGIGLVIGGLLNAWLAPRPPRQTDTRSIDVRTTSVEAPAPLTAT